MKRFTRLFLELDACNRTSGKVAALKRYFAEVPARDGAWAVYFLTGNRPKRAVRSRDFREWAGRACGFPDWMVETCYQHVGDLAETLALLLEENGARAGTGEAETAMPPLHALVEETLLPLREMDREDQRRTLEAVWARMDGPACFVFNKLITGGFRVGVSRTLVHRALAETAGLEPAVVAHRLMGHWRPGPDAYRALFSESDANDDPARPYPFCLAYPFDPEMERDPGAKLGPVAQWQVEWKWDGIRAQLIRREGAVLLWSRGEELVGEQFPEIAEAAGRWPRRAVLDGEILAWGADGPLGFAELQRRLGRKTVGAKLRREVPVVFMAYDILEIDGRDLREQTTADRRRQLESLCREVADGRLRLSPLLSPESWADVADARTEAGARGVEGLMLKERSAPYFAGRRKGEWWKWKVDPHVVDAVLVYAQQGHGRRAGLFTDYTFSVWSGDNLVPFAKAYSGLTDSEIRKVDRWIREHTREKHGPVRVVDPELVFEIAFEGISESKRHKSGVAVRFPRISRWRDDKTAAEADTLETVRALL